MIRSFRHLLAASCCFTVLYGTAVATEPARGPATQPKGVFAPTDPSWNGELVLALGGAIPANEDGLAIMAHLEIKDGRWIDTWGTALNFHQGLIYINVVECTGSGEELNLKLEVNYPGDLWIKPAKGAYTVKLQRKPATNPTNSDYKRLRTRLARAAFSGTLSGTFHQVKGGEQSAEGEVEGYLLPSREMLPGLQPAPYDEHPRMLLRKSDMPNLTAKLNTPLGQAFLARMKESNHEVATAILYRLTGEKKYADEVYKRISTGFEGEKPQGTVGYGSAESQHVTDYPVGHQVSVAFCYDLCYDAWTAAERRATAKWLQWMGDFAIYKPHTYANTGSTGSLAGGVGNNVFSGGAILAATLWGAPGEAPPEPKLDPFASELAGSNTTGSGEAFERVHQQWVDLLRRWQDNGKMDLKVLEMNLHSRRQLATLVAEQCGEGGMIIHRMLYEAAITYRNVHGRDFSARGELADGFIQLLMRTMGWQKMRAGNFPIGTAGLIRIDTSQMARFLALCPQHRSAIQAYWLRMVDMSAAEIATSEGAVKFLQRSFPDHTDPWGLLYTLQHWDTTITPTISSVPTSWEIGTRGTFLFRGGSADEPILVSMDSDRAGSGLGAGNFEIYGFGQRWTSALDAFMETRARYNVMYVPGMLIGSTFKSWHAGRGGSKPGPGRLSPAYPNPANVSSRGEILDRDTYPNGQGGCLSLDLTRLNREQTFTEREVVSKVRTGTVVGASRLVQEVIDTKDIGIRATRAMAVDFSGKCGAPALFVIADRFAGTKDGVWVFNLPMHVPPREDGKAQRGRPAAAATASPEDVPNVTIRPDGFELAHKGASLRVTFVSPVGPKIEQVSGKPLQEGYIGRVGKGFRRPGLLPGSQRWGVEVRPPAAGEKTDEFLVIMTLQKGAAPEVSTQGSGLDAKVKVGGQTVKYDGKRIIFGQ